jgi:F420-non-reducing hydrogenase iron-sulfur subunit
VDPILVAKAFAMGADGVLISGCHPGDCHYVQGNYFTRRRFAVLRSLLDFLGIEKERLRLEWVSATEGQRFAQVVADFRDQLLQLKGAG